MEDKYNELIQNGASNNEAVGTVISEFGNLDEISEKLGIRNVLENVQKTGETTPNVLSLEEAKEYLSAAKSFAYKIALGVFLCIISVGIMAFTMAVNLPEYIGLCSMMLCIVAAVIIFVYFSLMMQKWNYIKKGSQMIDVSTTNYLLDEWKGYHFTYAVRLTIGIALCVISPIPALLLFQVDNTGTTSVMDGPIEIAALLLFVAIGVFLIVVSEKIKANYGVLLRMSHAKDKDGTLISSQWGKVQYISPGAEMAMSLY